MKKTKVKEMTIGFALQFTHRCIFLASFVASVLTKMTVTVDREKR